MVRTQIQLSEEQARRLKLLASQQGKSVAELIRMSVDHLLITAGVIDIRERKRRARAAVGKFRSGLNDISIEHDRYLGEDFQ